MSTTHAQPSAATRRANVDNVSTAETIARFVAEGVGGSGIKGLEGPARTLLGIIVHYKRVRDNIELCKDVAAQIGALTETLKAATDIVRAHVAAQALPTTLVQAQLGSSAELTNRIDQLQRRLDEINTNAAKLQGQTRILRTVLANRNAEILKEMRENLRQAREDFMLAGQLAVEIALVKVAEDVRANSARQRDAELHMALDKLPTAEASHHASVHARHGHLLAGTREALLKELGDWAAAKTANHQEHPFYILSGGAGTGKSTIAYELASRAKKERRLGASFFFMRGSALLSSTDVFFPTLARQLILNVPALRDNAEALIQGHLKYGTRQNLDLQSKDLFTGLLSQLPSDHAPVVIVVDAVDECTDTAQDLVCRMLYLMMDALSQISCPVRIFVTSRPEVHIEDAFQARAFSSAQKFILHEIPRPVVDADIRLYFKSALAELPDGPRNSLTLLYPDALDHLTDLAAGLFIYATTAMEFLKQYRTAITQGMERLVLTARGKPKTAMQRLDELYTIVLQNAFPRDFLQNERDTIRAFLGNVAVLQDHIAPADLAILTGVSLENDIKPILQRLGAVLSFEPENPSAPMRPLHASFGEFLVDATRCTDPEFHVDLAQHHLAVADSCLALLTRPGILVHNVCRLPDPSVPRDEIDDLVSRVARYLPAPVQYSCKNWFVHLALSGMDQGITPRLLDFCRRRLLEWIEALVFLDSVDRMLCWLPILHRLYSVSGCSQDAGQLLLEIWRLVLEFAPAIKTCPQQVYLSALPLLPSSSKLLQTSNTLQVGSPVFTCRHGVVSEWPFWYDIHPSTLRGTRPTDIKCAVFEPAGRWIAVAGSKDGTIHFCRAETGEVFLSVHAHDNESVRHLCVSSNGLRLISTSNQRVCVISTRSGAVLRQFDVPPADGHYRTADFIKNDTAILIHQSPRVRDDDGDSLYIRDLVTDIVTELSIPRDRDNPVDFFWGVSVFGTGRWVIAVGSDEFDYQVGYFFDLFSGGVAYTLPFQHVTTACFVSGDVAVVPLGGDLCLFDIPTRRVVRKLEGDGSDHDQLAASSNGAIVISMDQRSNTIHVWAADGQKICISVRRILENVLLCPQGGCLLALTDASWSMVDMGRFTAPGPLAPPISVHLGEIDEDSSADHRCRLVAISPDCSFVAFAFQSVLRIFDVSGAAGATVMPITLTLSLEMSGPVVLAFDHHRRLIVVVTAKVAYLYDIARGVVLARYETPDDIVHSLSNEAQMRHFGLGPVDDAEDQEGRFTFFFRHAAFTPDDTPIVLLMESHFVLRGDISSQRQALYTVQWDFRCPGPCRSSVPTTATSLVPGPSTGEILVEADIDQNWNLRISYLDCYERRSAYIIPRRNWDGEDRGPNVVCSRTSLNQPFYLAADGWIMKTSTKRRVCWLPDSRISSLDSYRKRVAIRGPLVATVSNSGLLTILSMSERI